MATIDIPQPEQQLLIVGQVHPLRDDVVTCPVPYGMTIAEIMGTPASHVFVVFEGRTVPRHEWRYIRPKPGSRFEVKLLASGGGNGDGNKFVRTMLQVVVAATSMYVGGLYGLDTFAGAFAAASVAALGTMAVSALVPPQLPEPPPMNVGQSSFNRAYSLTGTRNQTIPYGVVPRVYGKHRFYPPYAAKPYTEIIGEDQYLRVLLNLGYGPLAISDIRIGQTPIAEFADTEYEISESPNLFANDVEEEQLGVVYDGNADVGTAHVRTTAINADEISIDFAFPQGLYAVHDEGLLGESIQLAGTTVGANVGIKVEYRAAGSSDPWLNAAYANGVTYAAGETSGYGWMTQSASDPDHIHITGRERQSRRCSMRWKVPNGQYDVRVTKVYHGHVGEVSTDDQKAREMVWATLRTLSYTLPVNINDAGILFFAARIKASGQLQGLADRINMVAEAYLDVWDGANWVSQKTRDPAWACVDAMCGPAAKRPKDRDTQIVKEDYKAWAADNLAKGRYFDAVIDAATTPRAIIRDATTCGRATPTHKAGKESIVRDIEQLVPVQMFTPRNSWGFSGSKHFYEPLHAVRVKWTNPEIDWQEDEITVYADGYTAETATEIGEIQTRGVTDYTQAWRAGRYYLAVSEQRRETFSFFADFENLRCSKGKLIRIAHDVINVGLRSARVKSVTRNGSDEATDVVIDETIEMFAGRNYALVVRRNDGTQQVQAITTVAGETNELEFTAAVPGVNEGDLVTFGYQGQETIDVIVRDIRRGVDSSAQLFVLPAAPEIHAIDTEVPPAYASQASNVIDPAIAKCCAPVLEQPGSVGSVRSSGTVANSASGGIRIPSISIRVSHQEP